MRPPTLFRGVSGGMTGGCWANMEQDATPLRLSSYSNSSRCAITAPIANVTSSSGNSSAIYHVAITTPGSNTRVYAQNSLETTHASTVWLCSN